LIEFQSFFYDRDEQLSAHCDPDLCFDCVLCCTQKILDSKMLFDPFEEQFHLPSLAVDVCNELGLECHVVGQVAESFPFVVFGSDAPDGVGIIFFCNVQRQNPNLISDDIGVLSVQCLRISALIFGIAFGLGHKECLGLMNLVKPCKIQVPAVHQIKGCSLDDKLI